jgi:hypothetical protein
MDVEAYPGNVTPLPPGSSSLAPFVFTEGELAFQVVPLRESAWIYVGPAENPQFANLSLAMAHAQSGLLGASEEGARIATHLQKRFRLAAVFVGYNAAAELAGDAERILFQELVKRQTFVTPCS